LQLLNTAHCNRSLLTLLSDIDSDVARNDERGIVASCTVEMLTTIGLNQLCSRTCTSKANSAFHPSWVGKWVPALAGKAKAGMVHSVNGWTRGVQVKLWDQLRMFAMFTTKRYTNPRLPLPYYLTLRHTVCEEIRRQLHWRKLLQ